DCARGPAYLFRARCRRNGIVRTPGGSRGNDGSVVYAWSHELLPWPIREFSFLSREGAGRIRRSGANEVLDDLLWSRCRRNTTLLSLPGFVAPRLSRSGLQVGT